MKALFGFAMMTILCSSFIFVQMYRNRAGDAHAAPLADTFGTSAMANQVVISSSRSELVAPETWPEGSPKTGTGTDSFRRATPRQLPPVVALHSGTDATAATVDIDQRFYELETLSAALQPGMTKSAVTNLLGAPSSVVKNQCVNKFIFSPYPRKVAPGLFDTRTALCVLFDETDKLKRHVFASNPNEPF